MKFEKGDRVELSYSGIASLRKPTNSKYRGKEQLNTGIVTCIHKTKDTIRVAFDHNDNREGSYYPSRYFQHIESED